MEPFSGMPDTARTWVYAANRTFTAPEQSQIQQTLDEFTQNWTAHNNLLKAEAAILHGRFVVIMVDENQHEISGCGIDKSVQLMKSLGEKFGIDFFNRLPIYVAHGNEVLTYTKQTLQAALDAGQVNQQTQVFNLLVQSKSDFDTRWIQPLSENWIAKQLHFLVKA